MAAKKGPLTRDELMSVWAAACDAGYRDPLLEAGDGGGLEVYSQAAAQLARVSEAVDTTSQALYILPHSGQTNDPADGDAFATVTLSITRTKIVDKTLVLGAGSFLVEEETTDYGPSGAVVVRPGRVYTLLTDLVFPAGETGPFEVVAQATQPGYGFNNPLPHTIKSPVQPGSNYTRGRATVIAADTAAATPQSPAAAHIRSVNEADTFIPEHVGQYVYFAGGLNQGKVARVVYYDAAPDAVANVGSVVSIALDFTIDATVFAGTFVVGEQLTLPSGVGLVLGIRDVAVGVRKLVYRLLTGTAAAIGDVVTGAGSGATATVRMRYDDALYTAEAPSGSVGGALWRVLDWRFDWGLDIDHAESPKGGKIGMLDELGRERDIVRAPNEPSSVFRKRVATLADVVAPNAIMRAITRALGSLPWCFREVGYPKLRGFFYDGDTGPAGGFSNSDTTIASLDDAYDTDVVVLTGVITSGVFVDQEPAQLETATHDAVLAGYMGRIDGGVTMMFIRKDGTAPASLTGLTVRGLQSGAIFTPTVASVPQSAIDRRFRRYFDYIEFRGFFLVGLPRLGFGDPGFAYDSGLANAYDAAPADAFYDGLPYGAADLYRRVYHAVDQARAGGVSFDFYIEDVGCR